MKNRKIYIQAAEQISIQNPLCEDWMSNPVYPSEPYMRSIDPDFKTFLSPLESRRFSANSDFPEAAPPRTRVSRGRVRVAKG